MILISNCLPRRLTNIINADHCAIGRPPRFAIAINHDRFSERSRLKSIPRPNPKNQPIKFLPAEFFENRYRLKQLSDCVDKRSPQSTSRFHQIQDRLF